MFYQFILLIIAKLYNIIMINYFEQLVKVLCFIELIAIHSVFIQLLQAKAHALNYDKEQSPINNNINFKIHIECICKKPS